MVDKKSHRMVYCRVLHYVVASDKQHFSSTGISGLFFLSTRNHHRNVSLQVTVGNIVNSPGYLDYDKSCDNDPVVKYSAIASALAALIIIVIIITACIQTRRKRRPLKKHFHHLSISTEEIYRPTNLYAQSKKRTLSE